MLVVGLGWEGWVVVAEAGNSGGGVLSTIDPRQIPLFEGDLAGVEAAAARFRKAGSRCTTAGVGVDSRFQGLAGCYQAPERWELLASTARVRAGAVSFGSDLGSVGDALADYASEMRPVAAALSRLFDQALAFTVSVSGDGTWERDKSKVETNNSLIHQVSAQTEAKTAIERRCANRIEALVGGRVWHASDRPGDPQFAYGAADIPDDAATPWGAPADWEAPWEHGVLGAATSYYKGVWIDGIGGLALGVHILSGQNAAASALAAVTGRGSWSRVGDALRTTAQAWAGLGKTAAGLLLYANPVGVSPLIWASHLHGVTPDWVRACGRALQDTAKATVAWDTWETDPARAAGAATFNIVTCFLPGGEASAAFKTTRGIRGTADAGLLGRLLGHTDDAPVPHLPDTVPDAAVAAARAGHEPPATAGDLARSIGNDARPHLPNLDETSVRRTDQGEAASSGEHPSTRHDLPDDDTRRLLIREDDDFYAEHNSAGVGKSHLDLDGNLRPANPEGSTRLDQHIEGHVNKSAKTESPFTSFKTQGDKVYGPDHIVLDLKRLRHDVETGVLRGVEIYDPDAVLAQIQRHLDDTAGRHIEVSHESLDHRQIRTFSESLGLSSRKTDRVVRCLKSMFNTRRDGEWLVKGTIPSRYLEGPFR